MIVEDSIPRYKGGGLWSCQWFQENFPDEDVSGWAYDQDISDTGDKPEKFGCRFRDLNKTIARALKVGNNKTGIADGNSPTVMSFLFFPFRNFSIVFFRDHQQARAPG